MLDYVGRMCREAPPDNDDPSIVVHWASDTDPARRYPLRDRRPPDRLT